MLSAFAETLPGTPVRGEEILLRVRDLADFRADSLQEHIPKPDVLKGLCDEKTRDLVLYSDS